jgi:hypothetical protein
MGRVPQVGVDVMPQKYEIPLNVESVRKTCDKIKIRAQKNNYWTKGTISPLNS